MIDTKANFGEWLKRHPDRRGDSARLKLRESGVPAVLAEGELWVVYQPIVELSSQLPAAYEVLARGNAPTWDNPQNLFQTALDAKCIGPLGRLLREMAITHCHGIPLFINVHPAELDESWLVQPDDPIFLHDADVFVEITESVPLTHYSYCHSVLREVRGKGVFLAVDDLGAGYSNLKYIADLHPDVVKLDRMLISGLDRDKRLRSIVRHMVNMCEDLGARIVAEGIETESELNAVEDCGVPYGQGYYLCRPAFPLPRMLAGPDRIEGNAPPPVQRTMMPAAPPPLPSSSSPPSAPPRMPRASRFLTD